PQPPLGVPGRRLEILCPAVPRARRHALGIAVMSYDGHLGFGLLGDFDALPELETIAGDLRWAIASLARAAGLQPASRRRPKRAPAQRKPATGASGNGATGDRLAASSAGKPASKPT